MTGFTSTGVGSSHVSFVIIGSLAIHIAAAQRLTNSGWGNRPEASER